MEKSSHTVMWPTDAVAVIWYGVTSCFPAPAWSLDWAAGSICVFWNNLSCPATSLSHGLSITSVIGFVSEERAATRVPLVLYLVKKGKMIILWKVQTVICWLFVSWWFHNLWRRLVAAYDFTNITYYWRRLIFLLFYFSSCAGVCRSSINVFD